MKIYIDKDYVCHVSPAEGLREFDVAFFDGMCDAFVEGYRFVPGGEKWRRPDGEVFAGQMIAPWRDYSALYLARLEHELVQARSELSDMGAALELLGVSDDE